MQERPVSVTIFGILNIGFGALALAGLAVSGMQSSLPNLPSNAWMSSVIAFMDDMNKTPAYIVWRDISVPLEAAANLALLAAGVGLLYLKNWARLSSIGYGIYKIVFLAANVIVLWLALGDLLQKALQNFPAWVGPVLAGVAAVGALLSLVYPGLLIFFMTRRKILPAFEVTAAPPVSTL